jgi:hypothetical protein
MTDVSLGEYIAIPASYDLATISTEWTTPLRRIALGPGNRLNAFAKRHLAEIWEQFAREDLDNWRFYFEREVGDPTSEVFFDLSGVDAWLGIARASGDPKGAGPLDWELLQIFKNPGWWPRIRWMRDGCSTSNPFA